MTIHTSQKSEPDRTGVHVPDRTNTLVTLLSNGTGFNIGNHIHVTRNHCFGPLFEATDAIGMTRVRIIQRIGLSSAMRKSIPTYSNEVILILPASVLASTITATDILGARRTLNNQYYVFYEAFQ